MATSVFKADRVGNLANLSTDAKTNLVAAINEVDGHADNVQAQVSNSGDAYLTSKAYSVGDLVICNNTLYRCTTACSAGSWAINQGCFVSDTLTNVVDTLSHGTINGRIIGSFTVDSGRSYKGITADIDTILSANWSNINLSTLKIKWGGRIYTLFFWDSTNSYQFSFFAVGTYVFGRTFTKQAANTFTYKTSQGTTITDISSEIATAGETVTIYC